MTKVTATKTQYGAKEQVSQDLLRRYLSDALFGAREFVTACIDGDDCPAFRDAAKAHLIDAAKTLHSLQVADGVFSDILSLIAKAIGAISVGALDEADEILGQAISLL